MIKDIQQRPDNDKDKSKLAKMATQFIRSFMKNGILDFKNYEDDLEQFINTFINLEEVANLKKFLQQGQKDWLGCEMVIGPRWFTDWRLQKPENSHLCLKSS